MLIGLCAAAVFFTICVFWWWVQMANLVPWLWEPANTRGIFMCFASIYLPLFPCMFAEVCHRKGVWSNPKLRLAGGFLFGTTLGFFESGRAAIFGEHPSLCWFHTEQFSKVLWGGGPAIELMRWAELLAMLNTFLDSWIWDARDFGIIAIAIIILHDSVDYLVRRRKRRGPNSPAPSF